MKKEISYMKEKFVPLKITLAILSLILVIVLISTLGNYIASHTEENFKTVTVNDLAYQPEGILVEGVIRAEDVIMYYPETTIDGTEINCIAVMTEDKRITVLSGSSQQQDGMYYAMDRMKNGEISEMPFKGKISSMPSSVLDALRLNMTMQNIVRKYKVDESNLTKRIVRETVNMQDNPVSVVVGTLMGIAMLIVLIYFLLRKTVNNIIYGVLIHKGMIEPDLKVRKEDIIIENEGYYQGDGSSVGSFGAVSQENDDLAQASGGYLFNAPQSEDSTPVEKMPKPSDPTASGSEDMGFYQGGLNEDGNFYVNAGDPDTKPRDESNYRRY